MKIWIKSLLKKHPTTLQLMRVASLYFLTPKSLPCKVAIRRALICYLASPFNVREDLRHSNRQEVVVMADVLEEMGYMVDVVDHHAESSINYLKYDLVIGFGNSYTKSLFSRRLSSKRILHMTGASLAYSNKAEAIRARSFFQRHGVWLQPRREGYWRYEYATINSDAIFSLGNNWTKSTFEDCAAPVISLPVPYVDPDFVKTDLDVLNGQQRFLWFGGNGALHKGLDLVLDAVMADQQSWQLDVCGPINGETDFVEFYGSTLTKNPRVKFHGFVDIRSEKMRSLFSRNTFVILPSCSEGGGSSVLSCMAAGLIPIVTKETSVDTRDYGLMIKDASVEAVLDAIKIAMNFSKETLIKRSHAARECIAVMHSFETYKKSLRVALDRVCATSVASL